MLRFLPLALLLFSAACGGGRHDGATSVCQQASEESLPERVRAYGATLKPLLAGQACTNCHGGVASRAPHLYLAADEVAAYRAARDLVVFEAPANSRFVLKVESGHNCGSSEICRSLAGQIRAQIEGWASQESALAGATCDEGMVRLPPRTVTPASVAKKGPLRWNVGEVNAALPGVWFQILAETMLPPTDNRVGAYRLSAPQLATPDVRYRVREMDIFIDGVPYAHASNFLTMDFVVDRRIFDPGAQVWGFPPLSDNSQLLPLSLTGHELALTFHVERTEAPPSRVDQEARCRSPELFALVMNGVLSAPASATNSAPKCLRCHGDFASAAFRAFPMAGSGVDVCLEALMRSDVAQPAQSLLIQKPTVPLPNHPEKILLSTAERQLIFDWLRGEAP